MDLFQADAAAAKFRGMMRLKRGNSLADLSRVRTRHRGAQVGAVSLYVSYDGSRGVGRNEGAELGAEEAEVGRGIVEHAG